MISRSSRMGMVALVIVAGACSGTSLLAQQSTGTLKGCVTDKATGAPKAGVSVHAQNMGTGFVRTAVTDKDGWFRLPILPLGNYKINFKSQESSAAMIRTCSLGQETDCSVKMAPAASATVSVIATADTAAQVNTSSAEVGVNVTAERLESLPVVTRNVMSAAVLTPGVQLVQGSGVDPTKKNALYISTGEGQGRGVSMNLDGGDNNSSDVGGYVSSIPMDAIGEFQVVTNQYKAEFGRSNAGFFNIVSKSGTNQFAGSVNAQHTNQSLRARKTDEGEKQDDNSTSISAVVSGPIIKDNLTYSRLSPSPLPRIIASAFALL